MSINPRDGRYATADLSDETRSINQEKREFGDWGLRKREVKETRWSSGGPIGGSASPLPPPGLASRLQIATVKGDNHDRLRT